MSNLESVNLKLGRAREHRKAIDKELGDLRKHQAYPVLPEIDPETREQIWRMDGEPPPPPDRIAVLIGDCLYNFRCALDHLAWELSTKPDNRTMFPIFHDPGSFSNSFWRLHHMSTDVLAMLVATQPCYGRNPHRNRMLSALESLTNVDKHRHLHVIAAGTLGAFWAPGSPIHGEVFIYEGPIHDQTILARFPPNDVKVQFVPAVSVAFAEGALPDGGEVLQALMGIDDVTCLVVDSFRQQFFPSAEPFPRPGD